MICGGLRRGGYSWRLGELKFPGGESKWLPGEREWIRINHSRHGIVAKESLSGWAYS